MYYFLCIVESREVCNNFVYFIFLLDIVLLFILSYVVCFFFFFSSRRRHTRWPRDWSSDVCSSDLPWPPLAIQGEDSIAARPALSPPQRSGRGSDSWPATRRGTAPEQGRVTGCRDPRKQMHCFPVATRAGTCRQGLRETSAQASGRKGRGALGACSRRQRKTQSASALAPGSSAGRYCDGYSEALFRAPLPQERAGKRS